MRTVLAVLGAISASASVAMAADVALSPGPFDRRPGDGARQWVTVRNPGSKALDAVYVRCTFFAGDRPVGTATNSTTGKMAAGGHETIEVSTSDAPGATRAECRAAGG